jgi:hypothetical protein
MKIHELMREVAEVATRRKALEAQEKELKDQLLVAMRKAKTMREKTEYGSFTIKPYTRYEYSEEVVSLEESLKIKKQDEVERGVAKAIVTESVAFSPAKE